MRPLHTLEGRQHKGLDIPGVLQDIVLSHSCSCLDSLLDANERWVHLPFCTLPLECPRGGNHLHELHDWVFPCAKTDLLEAFLGQAFQPGLELLLGQAFPPCLGQDCLIAIYLLVLVSSRIGKPLAFRDTCCVDHSLARIEPLSQHAWIHLELGLGKSLKVLGLHFLLLSGKSPRHEHSPLLGYILPEARWKLSLHSSRSPWQLANGSNRSHRNTLVGLFSRPQSDRCLSEKFLR